MPCWGDLQGEFVQLPEVKRGEWLRGQQMRALARIGALRGRHVLFLGSAFLQRPDAPSGLMQIAHEDINALMACLFGMDFSKGLSLILHTPGGSTNATETLVEYLHSKFAYIEAIVPTFSMSAGTMVCLGCDRIVMGRQSQLGPIDPHFVAGTRSISAAAVVAQFKKAQEEILSDTRNAHVWAPILSSLGPALLHEARNALSYGEGMVARWLAERMLRSSGAAAAAVARHFNDADTHRSHGRRIGRTEAREQGLEIEDLETSQELQDAVLSFYHLVTLHFECAPVLKLALADTGRVHIKQFAIPSPAAPEKGC